MFEVIVRAITGIATGVFQKTIIDPAINKSQFAHDVKEAITSAVEFTNTSVAQCFTLEHGALDEDFWKKEEVSNELWGTLVDRKNPQRMPDFNRLYTAYCDIWTPAARMKRLLFDQAMEAFWTYFLQESIKSAILSSYYLEKLNYLHDDTVYPYEARQMIVEYCRRVSPHLKEQIFNIFSPDEVKGILPKQKIRQEFITYRHTGLTYFTHRQYENKRDDKTLEGNSFLKHERLIIIGDGGVGKSRFLRDLEHKLVKSITGNAEKAEFLPIYLEADEFNDDIEPYLISKIVSKLKKAFQADERRYTDSKIEGFIRHLFMYKRFYALIDAFDQTRINNEPNVFTILAEDALFGKGRCCVSVRPYSLDYLLSGIKKKGGDTSKFTIIRLHPFDQKELQKYFKVYNLPHIDKFNDREGMTNVLQIPMLARLVKIMKIRGRFADPKFQDKMSRTKILKEFVDYVVDDQSNKDKTPDKSILEKKTNYLSLLSKLRDLSLKTLEEGHIYRFPQSYAEKILGNSLYLAQVIEFICPFIDYEHQAGFPRESDHRYQHQIFQEFFASWGLYELYTAGEKDKLLESLKKIVLSNKDARQTYMPNVGLFFAEMVELGCENEEWDFTYWQTLLMAPDTDDWVRTYALQVRDQLGAGKAKALLENLFAAEDLRLNHSRQDVQSVHIQAGPFIYGSYEHYDEQPVRLITLEAYEITRYTVTNNEFKRFLDSRSEAGKMLDDEDGNKLFDLEGSKIKMLDNSFVIEPGHERHPMYNITLYGARAFCVWLRQQDGKVWGLPNELQWEKAARGCLGRRYPWGNEFDEAKCNLRESDGGVTTPVDLFPRGRSPYGCYDMVGNVWEWTDSGDKTIVNWGGVGEHEVQVLRGCSYARIVGGAERYVRCAFRYHSVLDRCSPFVGFRCSRPLK